jgi:hypothetical protein
MSKKWTEAQPGEQAIVDLKEFNHGYNAYKESFNGGIDRTMLPEQFLDGDNIAAGAFHKVQITNSADLGNVSNIGAKVDTATGATLDWRGPSYTTYDSGWFEIDSVEVTDFKDGMCHWEYSFLYSNYIKYTWNSANTSVGQKGLQVRMMWDGVVVFESYKMPQPMGTARLIADFPITGGTHTASVHIRQTSRGVDDPVDVNIVNVVAPKHLFIGRWR